MRPRWTTDHAAGLRAFNRLLQADRPAAARLVLVEIESEYAARPPGDHLMTRLLLAPFDKCLIAQRSQSSTLRGIANVERASDAVKHVYDVRCRCPPTDPLTRQSVGF